MGCAVGISHALTEAMDEGHCGLPTEELAPLAEKLLKVPADLIRTAADPELTEGTIIADSIDETPCVFLAGLHRAERAIAERLLRLADGTLPWPWIDPDKALPWVEGRIGQLQNCESSRATRSFREAVFAAECQLQLGPCANVGRTGYHCQENFGRTF